MNKNIYIYTRNRQQTKRKHKYTQSQNMNKTCKVCSCKTKKKTKKLQEKMLNRPKSKPVQINVESYFSLALTNISKNMNFSVQANGCNHFEIHARNERCST